MCSNCIAVLKYCFFLYEKVLVYCLQNYLDPFQIYFLSLLIMQSPIFVLNLNNSAKLAYRLCAL